jgi:hypothetical protein
MRYPMSSRTSHISPERERVIDPIGWNEVCGARIGGVLDDRPDAENEEDDGGINSYGSFR